MERSTSFTVDGPVKTLVTITEMADGTLRFDLTVLGGGQIGDLRGLFIDIGNFDADAHDLTVTGLGELADLVGNGVFAEEAIDRVARDVNMKGSAVKTSGKFDGGVDFGTPGKGKDDIQSISFELSADVDLSLDSFDLTDLGLRYTSVGAAGGKRDGSEKIIGMTSGVARNDAWETDENRDASVDLLANDTDGAGRTIIDARDADGAFVADGAGGFTRLVVIDGLELGTLLVDADGIARFTADGADVDKLAHDDAPTFTFSYTSQEPDGDTATALATVTIDGQNDQPVAFDVAASGSEDAAVILGAFSATDIDIGDQLTYHILSIPMTSEGTPKGVVVNNGDGTYSFDPLGDFQGLGVGETETVTFTYNVTDDSGVGTSPTAPEETDTSQTRTVTITVNGQNDQPVAQDLAFAVDEDDASDPRDPSLIGDGLTGAFVGSDTDATDILSYIILSDPVDAFGNQYGEVTNNGDGTFTFNPLDNFQFLEAGETRDVTFTYVARDDSGVGQSPIPPDESDTSEVATVTITVTGSEDAPWVHSDQLLFVTEDQSMFFTGDAPGLNPDLPFLGFDTGFTSLDATIIAPTVLEGEVLGGILDGIEAVGQFFADLGCSFVNLFGGDCEEEVDIPSTITIPGVSTEGFFDARVGLQPYFEVTTGEVDATIPVDVGFSYPRQVENGDTFTIGVEYFLADGSTFTTESPDVTFGMDFVLDIAAELDLLIGATRYDIFDFDTGADPGFVGELGDPGFNLFDISLAGTTFPPINFGDFGSLTINLPDIDTVGDQTAPGSDTLTSAGQDDLAILNLDIDAVAAKIIQATTGVPIKFGDSDSIGLSTSVFGPTLNLISVGYSWDIIDIDIETTLDILQNFELKIEELPLVATFEDGTQITGLVLGDDITVTAPQTASFDPEVDGDGDGFMGVDIAVDMEAVFSNLTELGLDLDLLIGLLRFDLDVDSSFFTKQVFSLLDPEGDSDGFLLSETVPIITDLPLATLFEDTFDLEGWNSETTSFEFDIA